MLLAVGTLNPPVWNRHFPVMLASLPYDFERPAYHRFAGGIDL
jgi:hypothetical protein